MAGRLNKPNHCSGKPAAEFITQPLIGIAISSAYSAQWVRVAMRSCQRGVPGTGSGAPAYRRQARRNSINTRMVMPIDLCSA